LFCTAIKTQLKDNGDKNVFLSQVAYERTNQPNVIGTEEKVGVRSQSNLYRIFQNHKIFFKK